ncbi:MAG: DUF642 domain-containing protein, partial [Planctomycetota bacterium]
LANDTDPEGQSLSITSVSTPKFGTVSIDGDELVYTPNDQVVAGDDTFYYGISDGVKHDWGRVTVSLEHECIHLAEPSPVEISVDPNIPISTYIQDAFVYSIDSDGVVSNVVEIYRGSDPRVIDFEGLSAGTVVSNQIAGVTVTAQRNGDGHGSANDAMIFDSYNPTGGDDDLATTSNGNILIISEDNHSHDPDDNAGGGVISFVFDKPENIGQMTFIDVEEGGASIALTLADGSVVNRPGPTTENQAVSTIDVDVYNVVAMDVTLVSSGAIDNIELMASAGPAETINYAVESGTTIGIGIRNRDGGVFYSSGYGSNVGLNPDGVVHTSGIQNADGTVRLGFEDQFAGGDTDFDDIFVTVNLQDSGATLDNAHVDYSSTPPSTPVGLLANGSFESGATVDGYEWYDPSDIPGWETNSTSGNGTLEIIRAESSASKGDTFIELDRYGEGVNRIHQNIAVEAGQTYLLSFDLRSKRNSDYAHLDVTVDGQSLGDFVSHNSWNHHITEFTATSTGNVELEFVQLGTTDQAARLDNIQLYAVGENLVSNSDFSSPHGHGYYAEDHVPQWDVPGTDHGRIKIVGTTEYGSPTQYARLDYYHNSTIDNVIQQSVPTAAGQEYVLRFNARSKHHVETLRVFWEGNLVATIDPRTSVWSSESLVVTASGGHSELRFEQVLTNHTSGDILLDKIGVHELDCVENLPPMIDAIADQEVSEGSTLTLIATATDPDLPTDSLTFSFDGTAPQGMTIDPISGQ